MRLISISLSYDLPYIFHRKLLVKLQPFKSSRKLVIENVVNFVTTRAPEDNNKHNQLNLFYDMDATQRSHIEPSWEETMPMIEEDNESTNLHAIKMLFVYLIKTATNLHDHVQLSLHVEAINHYQIIQKWGFAKSEEA